MPSQTHRRTVLQGLACATVAALPAAGQTLIDLPHRRLPPKRATALVMGISHYRHLAPLPSAIRDAQLIAASLTILGLHTKFVLNPSLEEMEQALTRFRATSAEADLAVVYVAAHGAQLRGETHILAADTASGPQRAWRSLSEHRLATILSDRPRQKVLFLDCCRTLPGFATSQVSPGAQGAISAPVSLAGLHVTYAAQPGAPALDGKDGYSPFAGALYRALQKPGLEVEQMARRIRLDVLRTTGGLQVPWARSSLLAPVVLNQQRRPVQRR